ncbi:MAG: hypothetical protein U1E67_02990 [Hyphomicrobiales bacterium]
MRVRLALVLAIATLGGAATQAADIDYAAPGYSYDYCLELARDEARANISTIYLHPRLIEPDQEAWNEKQVFKQRKHEAQREQRKEKCI